MFLRYAAAKLRDVVETAAYRSYIADALLLISRGKTWDEKWSSFAKVEHVNSSEQEKKSNPDSIKSSMVRRLKGLAKS